VITFIIGLFIGGLMGFMFASILVMSKDESGYCGKKDFPVRFRVRGAHLARSVLR
jgi:hypothetical protein